jgi:hypothetical protein
VARSWTISGVGEPTREAVMAAAREAVMPLGQWVEQALKKALAEGLEPGVSIEEIEARRRQVVADAAHRCSKPLPRSSRRRPQARRTGARRSACCGNGCGSVRAGEDRLMPVTDWREVLQPVDQRRSRKISFTKLIGAFYFYRFVASRDRFSLNDGTRCTAARIPDHQLLCDTRIRVAAY